MGNFGDVLSSQSLGLALKKSKPNVTKSSNKAIQEAQLSQKDRATHYVS